MTYRYNRPSQPQVGQRHNTQGPRSFAGRTPKPRRRTKGQYIDPARFINTAVTVEAEEVYVPTHTFADFAFGPELTSNVADKGYQTPSPIQDQAIPQILAGHDVIGLANTGTGKTAAFLLPLLERMSGITLRPSVLIMTPTRELAQQIDEEFRAFARGMRIYSTVVVGGVNIERQKRELRRRPHVIIGTPGRIKDLINQGELPLRNIVALVLDEADRMLDMGFLPDMRRIIGILPAERQTLFFSATISEEIHALTNEFLRDPVTISVRKSETTDHVEQDVVRARDRAHKTELLLEMLGRDGYDKVVVFGETKYGVQRLSDYLVKSGVSSVAIHGNKNQGQRQRALDQFKSGNARVLVATDVAARGIDIPNVSHVINYDQPASYDDYVHRIGRTGRAGARGHAHTFIETGSSR